MKKEVIALLVLLLLIPASYAICGDSIIQAEETCENCPQDVICNSYESCVNEVCQQNITQNNSKFIYITIFVIIILTLLIITLYSLHKRKQYGFGEHK